ncbi:hypothetical protein NDU88_006174 [Pleurodeles waltl]|uniref:Uncharacterized protein n=1 Tax=Pleurodeles waltl TaxID=8319 RepID=A0AAV7UN69_PLEWA|nr:hypothetical protein NDU88_006174 [Pleurodeles waltl]
MLTLASAASHRRWRMGDCTPADRLITGHPLAAWSRAAAERELVPGVKRLGGWSLASAGPIGPAHRPQLCRACATPVPSVQWSHDSGQELYQVAGSEKAAH